MRKSPLIPLDHLHLGSLDMSAVCQLILCLSYRNLCLRLTLSLNVLETFHRHLINHVARRPCTRLRSPSDRGCDRVPHRPISFDQETSVV